MEAGVHEDELSMPQEAQDKHVLDEEEVKLNKKQLQNPLPVNVFMFFFCIFILGQFIRCYKCEIIIYRNNLSYVLKAFEFFWDKISSFCCFYIPSKEIYTCFVFFVFQL